MTNFTFKNFKKNNLYNIFDKSEIPKLKLLIPLLLSFFLLATNNILVFAIADKEFLSLVNDDNTGFDEEKKETKADDISEVELFIFLGDNCFNLFTTLKKQNFTFHGKKYLPPHKTSDNPPPECSLTTLAN